MQLFRPEALAGQDRLHGDVILVPQVSWRLLGIFLATTLAAAALFLSFARYSEVERIAGRLAAAAPAASGLRARFELSPAAAEGFEPGRAARIVIPGRTGSIETRIVHIEPARASGAAVIEAELPREGGEPLRPGMPVALLVESRPRSLAGRLVARLRGERP